MRVRRQRRLLRMIVLGLASAAVAAGSAQAKVIPYLSHGQGISQEQLAQLQGATPAIAVGDHYLDSNAQAAVNDRADSSVEVGGPAAGAYGNPVGTAPAVAAASSVDLGGAAAMTAIVDLVEKTGGDARPVLAHAGSSAPVRPDDRANHGPLTTTFEQPRSSVSSSDSFSWSDAGVGAGSALGLVLVAGAAMFTLRRGRGSQLAGT
jgi:hypothetical protein